jgi:ParB family chromosome partitioning protein
MGHARALLGLTQRRHQIEVGTLVAKKGLSVRETEALVRSMLARGAGGVAPKETRGLDPNVQRLQDELSEKLGAPVSIQHSGSGKGKVVVSYHSLDELDGILAHIR